MHAMDQRDIDGAMDDARDGSGRQDIDGAKDDARERFRRSDG